MMSFDRPAQPAHFEATKLVGTKKTAQKTAVQKARDAVKKAVDAGDKPDFPGHWRDDRVKREFMKAQHRKCGYYESKIAISYGDMEHYAPKAEVHEIAKELNAQGQWVCLWGKEVENLNKIEGRKTESVSDRGYWWRAYDWTNYLLACDLCNRIWKWCLFPVTASPRTLLPSETVKETALLLNPFDDDPIPHFTFDQLGQIQGLSDKGETTLLVCGLFRESLRDARSATARWVHCALALYLKTEDERDLECIVSYGHEKNMFCGMVRSIVLERLGVSWDKFLILTS